MKRFLPTLLDTLHALALALWLGSVVVFWLLVTSGFEQNRNVPTDVVNVLLGTTWSSLGLWAERCGIVMVGVQFVLRRRFQRNRQRFIGDSVRQLITFSALLVTEYAHRGVPPRAILSHTVPGGAYLAPDTVLMGLCSAQIVLLTGVIALTAWLHQPTIASTSIPGSASMTPAKLPTPTRPTAMPRKKRVAK